MNIAWPWQRSAKKSDQQLEAERQVDELKQELARRRERMLAAVIEMNKEGAGG